MKILIIRVGRLGDMVMILPALKALMRRHPDATFHAITSIDGIRLLKTAGIEEKNLLVYRRGVLYRFIDEYKVKRYIADESFDQVYCFELKDRMVSWLPSGANVITRQKLQEHYAQRCLKLVNPNAKQLHQENYLSVNAQKRDALTKQLRMQGIEENTILIGFHPTFSCFGKFGKKEKHLHRMWPWENFSRLAILLAEYASKNGINLNVVMDLLPHERKLGLNIQGASQGAAILLPTQLDFQRYLCFIQRLDALIVPDTGIMHLAAALGTPVVALFSGTHPDDCGPYMPKDKCRVLRAEATTMPQLGLAAISVEQVFESTIQLLTWSNGFGHPR